MARAQNRHWWFRGRRAILKSVINGLNLPEGARILEAGCGPGGNLEMLQQYGTVQAFEPFEPSIAQAQKASECDIRQGGLPDEIPFEGPFDLVGAFDVIEHIEEDEASLKALCEVTAEGGYAVFTVPAFQWLWSRHDEINHHKRRYHRKQFRARLEGAGYSVQFISYYNMFLFPVAVAVRLLRKIIGEGEPASDVEMPRFKFINDTLCFLFSSERFILRFMPLPFGLSLIAVCRKEKTK